MRRKKDKWNLATEKNFTEAKPGRNNRKPEAHRKPLLASTEWTEWGSDSDF